MRGWVVVLLWGVAFLPGAQAARLLNPGFETGTFDGWLIAGQDWRVSTWHEDQRRGAYGAVTDVFTNGVSDEYRIVFQEIKASSGKSYQASVWIRTVCLETTECFLEVQFMKKNGEVLQQFQSAPVKKDQEFSQTVIPCMLAPEGTEKACVRGVVHILSEPIVNTDWLIFDNFDFDVITPSELRRLNMESPKSK